MNGPTRRVDILVHDNVTMIDVAGPADVFHHANAFGGNYETVLVSTRGQDARASNGLRLSADRAPSAAQPPDTIIIPGAYGMVLKPFEDDLIEAVTLLTADARRVSSVCTGAFLLAQIGLLNYRKATTHWTHIDRFTRAFPLVRVQPDALYVKDDRYITSAGISSGVDLALSMVEEDLGPDAARSVVRQMVIFTQRAGTHSQQSVAARTSVAADRPLRALLDLIISDPSGNYSLASMASIAKVSTRNLSRLFRNEIGSSPARYVETVRIEAAQTMLQNGSTVAATAAAAGFGSAETLRRVFTSRLGMSPSVYVERVRASGAA